MSRSCVARVGQVWRTVGGGEWTVESIDIGAADIYEVVTLRRLTFSAACLSDIAGQANTRPGLGEKALTVDELKAVHLARPMTVEPAWFEHGAAKLLKEAA